MSQLIACKNKNGIVLATDSKALDVDPQGHLIELQIERLVPLTSTTAILTGGAAAGEKMCRALKEFITQEGIADITEIYTAALPFLASEYERFMRRTCEIRPLDPIHQVVFILAGYTATALQNPFRLYLLWTKKKLPQLDGDEISSAFTVPRIIRLEYKLNQLCEANAPLDHLLSEIRTGLEKQAKVQDEIAPPFTLATI
ncbi:MAG: hypothetical protein JSW39_13820, partial [Desulfobacterales bacterium]